MFWHHSKKETVTMGRCGIKRQKFCHDIDSIGGVKSLFHAASELHTLCVVTAKSGEWSDTLLFHLLWECPRRGADLVKRNDSLSLSWLKSDAPQRDFKNTHAVLSVTDVSSSSRSLLQCRDFNKEHSAVNKPKTCSSFL